ncbi:uncharacterized protein B0T15DRAFT_552916 [Chaetomium strumarium]|uniref:Uncharacterized protein n=1 Tax=Chaetomium strumarium TaxID=1170767 RepID=A0AAJ0M2S6_9PEZI|nr:hypothetical protein B0T15DRAFT_552916 [Chaetomium strumarium]
MLRQFQPIRSPIQHQRQLGGKTPRDFLGDPKNSIKNVTRSVIAKQNVAQMASTWASKTGRCTSFVVKASNDLSAYKDKGQPVYDFKILSFHPPDNGRWLVTSFGRRQVFWITFR